MSRATPRLLDLAERLVGVKGGATTGKTPAGADPATAFVACEKLRPQLATLMGNTGFSALLTRALTLAGSDVPWLRAVQLQPDGSLAGLGELGPVAARDIAEAEVVLLAQLLGLLVAFIGEDLTLRLAREAWPRVPQRITAADSRSQR